MGIPQLPRRGRSTWWKYIDQQTLRDCLTNWTVYVDQGLGSDYKLNDVISAKSVQRHVVQASRTGNEKTHIA